MLDQFDFRLIADRYTVEHPEEHLIQSTTYMMVYWLLSTNIEKPKNITYEQFLKLSQYLEQEGYYAKAGRRPKHHNSNFKDLC